ncbi:MAG: DUF547 domain-containing protein [Rhodothermales bacterium]
MRSQSFKQAVYTAGEETKIGPSWPAILLLGACLLALTGCTSGRFDLITARDPVRAPERFDHGAFDTILGAYVRDGLVDYAGLKASGQLDAYLEDLAETDPANMNEPDQLAFWLNAYNALTLKLIVENYPTKSILRLAPRGVRGIPFIVPKVNTPFKVSVGQVAGVTRTLDEIEHTIIRPTFAEPRVHFALVCAAMSCPPLREEAYAGERLDAQLDDQGRRFLHDEAKNQVPVSDDAVALSKIFKWFEADFGGSEAAVQQFIARYFDGDVGARLEAGGYRVDYLGYDWTLNDQSAGE